MSLENANLSRRTLLRAGALGVPAAGVLAFGSTLVTATSANAISADGWWGEETSAGLQRFMNAVRGAGLVVDGVISSQPSHMAPACPGIVGGWEWVEPRQAEGSPTILHMSLWLGLNNIEYPVPSMINNTVIENLQKHYGISQEWNKEPFYATGKRPGKEAYSAYASVTDPPMQLINTLGCPFALCESPGSHG